MNFFNRVRSADRDSGASRVNKSGKGGIANFIAAAGFGLAALTSAGCASPQRTEGNFYGHTSEDQVFDPATANDLDAVEDCTYNCAKKSLGESKLKTPIEIYEACNAKCNKAIFGK